MYDAVIYDGNNVFCRNYMFHCDKDVKGDPIPSQVGELLLFNKAVQGFMFSLKKIDKNYLAKNGQNFYLFDNPKSKIDMKRNALSREQLSDMYKKSRDSKPKAYYTTIDYIRDILANHKDNNYVCRIPKLEADDIVKPLIQRILAKNPNAKILMISDDLDWARMISDNVHQLKGDKILDPNTFFDKYNFKPTENSVVLYKVITGDTSDGIPIGIKGMRKTMVQRLVTEYRNIHDIFLSLDEIEYLNDLWRAKIRDNAEQLKINHQLVSFIEIPDEIMEENLLESKFRSKVLHLQYKALGINSGHNVFDPRVQFGYNDDKSGAFVFSARKLPRK